MNNLQILIFLLIINSSVVFTQDHDNIINTSPAQFNINRSKSLYEFNPLHVGDIWQYRFEDIDGLPKYYTTRIVKDSVINGKNYFKKIDWRFEARPPVSIVKYISWERNDSISGISYMLDFEDIDDDGDKTEEFQLDNFILPDRSFYESYKYSFRDEPNYVGKKNALLNVTYWSNVFGDTVLVKIIEYYELFIIEQIADKFGIISMRQESPDRFLTGAIINGTKYGVIVSVEDEKSELPKTYKLFQNYPNPFNGSTIITYNLPKQQKVELIVYDTLGKEVMKLVDKEETAGMHTVRFNPNKKNLSSGVYICYLKTPQGLIAKQMIFLK